MAKSDSLIQSPMQLESLAFSAQNQLEAQSLSMSRDDRTLFRDLSFTIAAGQILVVEGTNGSGKTTLLRILSGLLLADSGEVLWNGKDILKGRAAYQPQMAYLGHHNGLKLELTALENLRFTHALSLASAEVDYSMYFDAVGLAGYEYTMVQAMSAGQRRRLALARTLICRAPLWILDEPLTALDRSGVALVEQLIAQHCEQGGMVVLSTHHEMTLMEYTSLTIDLAA